MTQNRSYRCYVGVLASVESGTWKDIKTNEQRTVETSEKWKSGKEPAIEASFNHLCCSI
jgi:hypothetical protein